MKDYIYKFINDLYESFKKRSNYNKSLMNLYDGLLELMLRDIGSELRYIFHDNGDDVSERFFQKIFAKYKIEHLLIGYNNILSQGKCPSCFHSNSPVKYLLSVNFDDEELNDDSDDEELSEDFDVKELMDRVIEIKVCEECYNYFYFCIFYFCIFDFEFDLSEWMHINHLGWIKITPLTFNSTEI